MPGKVNKFLYIVVNELEPRLKNSCERECSCKSVMSMLEVYGKKNPALLHVACIMILGLIHGILKLALDYLWVNCVNGEVPVLRGQNILSGLDEQTESSMAFCC